MDFYTIPFSGQQIIYRPLRHLAVVGNAAMADYVRARVRGEVVETNETVDAFLEEIGFWGPPIECEDCSAADELEPTHAVLLMSKRCNLRCTYCYADAGREGSGGEMDWAVAEAVIRTAAANARRSSMPLDLTFHGGGEPTMHWALLERAVQYARSLDGACDVSMSTNGVWSDRHCRYIIEHFTSISLSMDGLRQVQDTQRPLADGSGSFDAVMRSIHAMDGAGTEYGVRMTVLPGRTDHLADSVRFLCAETNTRTIQIEPTFTSIRGHYADIDLDFAEAFSEAFMEAWRVGRDAGISVYYSGARPWVVSSAFCMAPLRALVATPGGRLTTCFEVFDGDAPEADAFAVGRVVDGRVEHDRDALSRFLSDQETRRSACEECFCYWHCCGDCATRQRVSEAGLGGRCHVTQTVTREMLAAFIEEGDGIWQGMREVAIYDDSEGEDGPNPARDA